MHDMNRRTFLAASAAAGAGLFFFPMRAFAALRPNAADDPHFFLQIVLQQGADPTYLYDARPKAMTAANLIQNYNTADSLLYTGSNGGTCLLPESSKALRPFLDRFTILNGVIMNPTFDGHTQNMNFYFTGSPMGGASFLPNVTEAWGFPLDGVQNGSLFADVSNHGHVVPLDPATATLLRTKLNGNTPIAPGSELHDFLSTRYGAIAGGTGRVSTGAKMMLDGFRAAPTLRDRLLDLETPDPNHKAEEQFVALLGSVFRHRVAGTALWTMVDAFDTHGADQAKNQPKLFTDVTERLALIFRTMMNTPFDATRSLLDVTTVVVNSEFSRTMRQLERPIDDTGTDHNQFNNSFLVGGKGIKGGQVIGASDMATAEEKPSDVHKNFDPKGLKLMGRAFDYSTQRPTDSPSTFDPQKYLTSDSVVNTIYSLFSVSRGHFRTTDRDGKLAAPVIGALLS